MIAGTMSLLPFARLVASDWKFDGYQPRRLTLEDFGSSLSCVSFIDSQASANLAFKELSRAVEQSSQADELVFVGLDVETKPCFVKGTSEPAALLQLAIGSKVYLVRTTDRALDRSQSTSLSQLTDTSPTLRARRLICWLSIMAASTSSSCTSSGRVRA